MAYTSHLRLNKAPKGGVKSSAADPSSYGRVVHVVLSTDDPKCKDASMVNGVFYRILKLGANEDTTEGLNFAYQGNTNIRTIPLEGEIVQLQSKPGIGAKGTPEVGTKYWVGVIPVWNHPYHNASPDTKQLEWRGSLLGGLEEQSTINPLQANPGDTILEGRLGQSIRLGGNKGSAPGIIDDSNNGKPVIVVSNGQIETNNGSELIQENIDEDYNSIYLVSDHKVPITPANTKRSSYNQAPPSSDQYKGNQVIVNGGRLYFNAKEESILLSAKQSIGLNANTLNFDGQEYMCLDADKIYIGSRARTSPDQTKQPAILGKQFEFWITQLLNSLTIVADSMTNASAVGAGPVSQLNSTGPVLKASIDSLKRRISGFQSRKVYIE
jgi:hypothetical protein